MKQKGFLVNETEETGEKIFSMKFTLCYICLHTRTWTVDSAFCGLVEVLCRAKSYHEVEVQILIFHNVLVVAWEISD